MSRHARHDQSVNAPARRALAALRGHPRGMALVVLARESGVPAAELKPVLAELVHDGLVEQVVTGFYRAVRHGLAAAA